MAEHPIFDAIEAGDVERVRELASDLGAATARDEGGVSALMQSQYRGRDDMVDALLSSSTELDVFEAAAVGRADRLCELLDRDPGLAAARSTDGFSPLHLAAFFGRVEVVDALLERGAPLEEVSSASFAQVTPLGSAAAAGHAEIARKLLDAGANANVRGENAGFTPLHAAADNGDTELAGLLLDRGADASAETDDGRTPRDLALASGHDEVAALLGG